VKFSEPEPGPGADGDPEMWVDDLAEPIRAHEACPECGCSGMSSVVRFIPVDADGGGILTPEDYARRRKRAMLELSRELEREAAEGLDPVDVWLGDEIVMQVLGLSNGTWRATIIATGGNFGQTRVKYGRGSRAHGAKSWRHALALASAATEVTTEAEKMNGIRAFEGEPGTLMFRKQQLSHYTPDRITEQQRIERNLRDRLSPTTAWERHGKPQDRRRKAREAALEFSEKPPSGGES
jgi:hypothetical protein